MERSFSYIIKKEYQYFYERFPSEDYDSENRFPINYRDNLAIHLNTPIRKEYFIGCMRKTNCYNKYRRDLGSGSSIAPICPINVVKYYTNNMETKGW